MKAALQRVTLLPPALPAIPLLCQPLKVLLTQTVFSLGEVCYTPLFYDFPAAAAQKAGILYLLTPTFHFTLLVAQPIKFPHTIRPEGWRLVKKGDE